MTEYNSVVEDQKNLLEAEEWAKKFKCIHVFNQDTLSSMWYDNRKNDGWVTDVQYNSGLVERTIHKTNKKVYFGKALQGQELIEYFHRR